MVDLLGLDFYTDKNTKNHKMFHPANQYIHLFESHRLIYFRNLASPYNFLLLLPPKRQMEL